MAKQIIKENKYSKEQILTSKRYINSRDILHSILSDNEEYTTNEVDELLNKFMKGKVI